jgi:hypothetical protein
MALMAIIIVGYLVYAITKGNCESKHKDDINDLIRSRYKETKGSIFDD